jgi:hypothetical protein
MIISASRRTDVPAFYARWFMNRIREGWCTVPNPFNPKQVSRISLKPEDVDLIVFWTRYARPLIPYLDELNDRGYRYCFLHTLMNNPRILEPKSPAYKRALSTFQSLSSRIGHEKMTWRYDPIVLTQITHLNFHSETYQRIAECLKGYTKRSIISIVDIYAKVQKRLKQLEMQGIRILEPTDAEVAELMKSIAAAARSNGMEIQSCAETPGFEPYGIQPGKCIDERMIQTVFGLAATHLKDPSQRPHCGCVKSRDIGMYDTCLFGCCYCYATTNVDRARERHNKSDPDAPSLTGFFRESN